MAKKATHNGTAKKEADPMWLNVPDDDAQFDELLFASLKPVSPPEDFCDRVMSAVAAEPAPQPAKAAKVIHLHWRRFAMGLGTCAAAFALFVGVSAVGSNDPTALLVNKPTQVAEVTPAISAPQEKTVAPTQTQQPEAPTATTTVSKPVQQATPSSGEVATDVPSEDVPLPVTSDQLVLPRTAYGTQTEGTLATRLLATVEGNQIYQPVFADKSAVFNTADANNVYSWRVDLTDPSEPQAVVVAAWDDLPSRDVLQNTSAPVDANTLVNSPDKTMIAQNSSDGMWISLLEGEVFKLTNESGGSIVAWAPDSSKLVFTNADGALFVGYPFEKRIYQLADGGVKDVCWHGNNKTLLYVMNDGSGDGLYIVETY